MRKGQIVQLAVLTALIAAATTAVAVLIPWLPVSASEQSDRIAFTFWLATGICIFIFAVVVSGILYSVLKFRARPDDDTDGPPIHGHTGLEIAWTAVPALLVTVIAIAAAVVLSENGNAGSNPLEVNVTAEQFAWTFTYANGGAKGVTTPILRLPINRPVKLELKSKDVVHSFWVPRVRAEDGRLAVHRRVPTSERARDHAEQARHVPGHLRGALRPRPLADALDGDRAEAG